MNINFKRYKKKDPFFILNVHPARWDIKCGLRNGGFELMYGCFSNNISTRDQVDQE